jgi:GT2 family glycosyltransferase
MSIAGTEICVAVATRGRPARLSRLLDSLEAQTLGPERFEVVVAVDGPDPATERLLTDRAASTGLALRTVVLPSPGGPATARNAAWRLSGAPVVAFTDDDCEAHPEWLETLAGAAHSHPGAVIQGPTVPNPADRNAEGPFSRTQRITEPGPWFQTCNIAYPRELLERLGGFDERFTEAAGEDVDLGWRAAGAGAPLCWTGEARVLHAIDDLGPHGFLRQARRGADSARVYSLHPELRRMVAYRRIFWKRSHARLLLALAGLLLARRLPPALLLTLPYAKGLRGRAAERGGSAAALVPWLIAYDVIDVTTAMRGSIRHRVAMI